MLTDSSVPTLRYAGLLMDLLAPLRNGIADGCTIEGSNVRWQFPAQGRDVPAGLNDTVIRRFDDRSTDWAQMLLGQHFTEEDMFLHALAGPATTFKVIFDQSPLASGTTWTTHNQPITVRIEWTSPRRIHLSRPVTPMHGKAGTGKSATMYAQAAAAAARGHRVVFIDLNTASAP
jgi:hypothetical protein